MWRVCVLGLLAIGSAAAASIGEVVVIGGQAADIALDESRGVLYVANFTAARIDILGLADRSLRSSMHVAPGPSALALSRDGRYLVAAHFGNPQPPAAPANALTIVDLASGGRQTLALANPPLGVAFGADGRAMIATTAEFLLLDPSSGRTELIDTVANATASALPAPAGTPPLQIVGASLAASADGRWIFGLADTLRFAYDVSSGQLNLTNYTATPHLGPRVVSVASDGSYYAAGWGVFDRRGFLQAQFAAAAGLAAVGSHAIDSAAGLLYSQIPRAPLDPAAAPCSTAPAIRCMRYRKAGW